MDLDQSPGHQAGQLGGERAVEVWTEVKRRVSGFWGWLKSKIRTVWEWVKTKTVQVWDWTCNKASKVWDWAIAKAPAIASKVMAGVGWVGARFAQLGMAAKVGVVAVTSTAAAVVASPVVLMLGALAVATMILSSKPKPKVRTVVQPSSELIEAMRARQRELEDQIQEANDVMNYKLSSELLGRHQFLEEKIKGNLGKESASATRCQAAEAVSRQACRVHVPDRRVGHQGHPVARVHQGRQG